MEQAELLVSVIVLTYNDRTSVRACLDAVLSSKYPYFEVIVFDNGSKDGTTEILTQCYGSDQRVRLILSEANLGVGLARNIGIREAKGQILAFLDSDAIPDPDWMDQPIEIFQAQSEVGQVQSRIIGGGGWSFNGRISTHAFLKSHMNPREVIEIPLATGPCIFCRNVDFSSPSLEVLYDPWLFQYHVEGDFSWLMRRRGWKVMYSPLSVVSHIKEPFPPRTSRELTDIEKNLIATMLKNYPSKDLLKITPSMLAYIFGGMMLSVMEGSPTRIISNFKAYVLVISNFRYLALERRRRQKHANVSPEMLPKLEYQTFNLGSMIDLWRRRRIIDRKREFLAGRTHVEESNTLRFY